MHSFLRVLLGFVLWTSLTPPARAAWLRAESPNFIVFAEQSEADLREQIGMLENYALLLRTLTRTEAPPSPNKLRVYLVRGGDQLNQVRDLPRGGAGVYVANAGGIAAVADARQRLGSPLAVLFHEYAHHFLAQYHGRVYPAWYVEGFAEFMMSVRFTDRTIEFGHLDEVRGETLAEADLWLPMEHVLFRTGHPPGAMARYYAQSWLLTHYLLSDQERLQRFRSYLAALQRADAPAAAFERSFGITPGQLQARLRSYAFGGLTFMRMPRPSAAASAIRIERMPSSADDLLLLQAALHVGRSDMDETLARVRSAAARHSDPFARRVLAQAEALAGDGAVADRLIDELLAADPGDAELMYFRGMRFVRASRAADPAARGALRRQARSWFARAHRLDPNHFQTLYRYVETHALEPNFLSDNNVEALLLAHTLAPQVGEIRLAAARMLLAQGSFDLAETLVGPLIGTAHESSLTGPARDVLTAARSRRGNDALPIFATN